MRRFANKLKDGTYTLADRPELILSEKEFRTLQRLMRSENPGQHPGVHTWVVFCDFSGDAGNIGHLGDKG